MDKIILVMVSAVKVGRASLDFIPSAVRNHRWILSKEVIRSDLFSEIILAALLRLDCKEQGY